MTETFETGTVKAAGIETVGKVKLDYSKYPGQDFYCDGSVEDELLEIVKTYPAGDYSEVIQERKKWPILYHLSPLRENIVEWIPMDKSDKVLEVGSGCGAITGALAKKAGAVTCVDLSRKRSLINAYRHSDCENVTIHVGNFKDIEPDLEADYDYICLIGVFEYGQSYIGGKTPYEDFLRILMRHLAPDGRIVIAIENKYGLKYFAGCKEDHLGTYFSGIENYADGGGVRTFGRKGLEKIFAACGVTGSHFYYPYPDYKFMTTLYSDKHLPGKGELVNNLRNFDRDRMLLFHEKEAFDGLIEEELFPVFSNSYIAVLGEDFEVEYARYSNDRAPQYQIRTQIDCDGNGKRLVRKSPLSDVALRHVRGMEDSYHALCKRYQGSALKINMCSMREEDACFEYIEGVSLSQLMDRCLETGDKEGFLSYLREFVKRIGYGQDSEVTDMDPVFSNILVSGEEWTLIDYEWTFRKKTDIRELAYRAVYCYLLEDKKREKLPMEDVLAQLKITPQEAEKFRAGEMEFQQFVTGNNRSMAQIRDDIGYQVTQPVKWVDRYQDAAGVNRVQIYEDKGQGYQEENSYFVQDAYQGENLIEFTAEVSGGVKNLRIDPAMDSCIVKIQEMTWNGLSIDMGNRRVVVANGRIAESGESILPSIVFPTTDPNINIRLERLHRLESNRLNVKMEIVRIPMAMAVDMAQKPGGILRR